MKKVLKLVLLVFILLIAVSCILLFGYPEKIIKHLAPNIEQINDIKAIVKNDTAFINAKIIARNKSIFTIKMDTIKYKIGLSSKTYFFSEQSLGMILKSYNKDSFNLSFKIPYKIIIDDLKSLRKKGDSASYDINLAIQYSTFLGKSELPIKKSSKLKIPEPPEVAIVDVKYKKMNKFKHFFAEAKLKITNHSVYNLNIKNMDYTINIEKFANIKGTYPKTLDIKGNTSSFIYLPIEVEMKKMGKSILNILSDDSEYNYKLVVNAVINSSDFDQEKPTHITLTKEDKMKLSQ